MKVKKFASSLVALGVLLVVMVSGAAANTTVIVTGDTSGGENQLGWMFNRDPGNVTPFEFTTDEASIGVGSLYVEPIGPNPADKFIGEYFFLGPIEDFDSFSYDFLIGGGGTVADANHFYLNVYTNLPGQSVTNFYDCRFDFIPQTGSTTSFDAFSVGLATVPTTVTPRGGADCPATLGDLPAGSTIRVFSINVGDTSTNDMGLDGYLDNVVLTGGGMATTFDFEPALTPETKDDCKNGGWLEFNSPVFKNQGDCVSFVASNGRSHR